MTSEQTPKKIILLPKDEKFVKLATKPYTRPQLTLFGEVKNLTLGVSIGGTDSLLETLV